MALAKPFDHMLKRENKVCIFEQRKSNIQTVISESFFLQLQQILSEIHSVLIEIQLLFFCY